MRKKTAKRGLVVLAGTMALGGPAMVACLPGPTYEQWADTDGAAGRINLDAVQDAFKDSDSVSEFERRVNQIYEGDGVVLIRASRDQGVQTLEGFEDLNGDGNIDSSTDDLLFSIVKEQDNNQLRGHGANGYYRSSFGGGDFLFTYLLLSSMRGPYYYRTPPGNAGGLRTQRGNYRGSPAYRSQVSKNTSYFSRQKSFHGSRYSSAGRNLGRGRQSYLATQKRTGAFSNSRTGVRSSWGSRSGGRGFGRSASRGRFGGFGGAQVIIGGERG